jgi:hypothetical protein
MRFLASFRHRKLSELRFETLKQCTHHSRASGGRTGQSPCWPIASDPRHRKETNRRGSALTLPLVARARTAALRKALPLPAIPYSDAAGSGPDPAFVGSGAIGDSHRDGLWHFASRPVLAGLSRHIRRNALCHADARQGRCRASRNADSANAKPIVRRDATE